MLACALVLFAYGAAFAQNIDQAVDLEDQGLTDRLPAGSRPAGLAGAYTAVGGDVHSLVYNPAGLAALKRIEVAIGFQHDNDRNRNRFFGTGNDNTFSSTNLDYFAVAYPFPTYRGSLVGAFGIYRLHSADLDLFYSGYDSTTGTLDNFLLQQSGSVFGYNFGVGVDLSPTISGGFSFFVLDGNLSALTQWSFAWPGPLNQGDWSKEFLSDDVDADLDGYGASIGLQYFPRSDITVGLSVTTPVWIYLDGDFATDIIDYYVGAPDSIFTDDGLLDIEYRLPFKIKAGLSYHPLESILLSAEVGYSDWTEATINKKQVKISTILGTPRAPTAVFREVVNARIGLEITLPGLPVKLRGGYAYLPYPLGFLQGDRISGDAMQKAKITKERQMFTIGAGGLLGKVLALDAALTYTTGEREIPDFYYRQRSTRFSVSASYRF
jgi:hypothetical protein